jgi:hypothetical protein
LIYVLAITIAFIPRSTVSIPDAGPAITGAP